MFSRQYFWNGDGVRTERDVAGEVDSGWLKVSSQIQGLVFLFCVLLQQLLSSSINQIIHFKKNYYII